MPADKTKAPCSGFHEENGWLDNRVCTDLSTSKLGIDGNIAEADGECSVEKC